MLPLCMLKEISTALLFSRSSRVFIDGIVLNQEPGVRGKIFFCVFYQKGFTKSFYTHFYLWWITSMSKGIGIVQSWKHYRSGLFFVPYFTNWIKPIIIWGINEQKMMNEFVKKEKKLLVVLLTLCHTYQRLLLTLVHTSLSNLVVWTQKNLFDNHGHAMSLSHDVTIISALNWGLMPCIYVPFWRKNTRFLPRRQ